MRPASGCWTEGPEARLFIEAVAMLVDFLVDGDCDLGVDPFDQLQRNQKIAVLHALTRALLCRDEPPPKLTAVLESAAALVFNHP